MNEKIGQRVPVDYFRVDIDRFPRPQETIFETLRSAAALGGELYLEQRNSLKPYQHRLEELAKQDPLVNHPLTIPDRDGRFISLWEHPTQVPVLKEARRLQLAAAKEAERAGLKSLAEYLYYNYSGRSLTRGNYYYDEMKKRYVQLVRPVIDYHLLPIETEAGFGNKQFWQGFLGLTDLADSQELQAEAQALREISAATLGGNWYTPLTNVTIDRVAVMAGWISLLAQGQRRQEKGLPAEGGLSAQNFPNEASLTRTAGSRIIIYVEPFREVCQVTSDICRRYLDSSLIPTPVDLARFLVAHELAHDERYDHHLGWLHSAVREAYANHQAIVAAAATWGEQSELFQSVVKGALGYAFRDSDFYLRMDAIPNLLTLVERLSHTPGNLSWLYSGVQQERFLAVKNNLLVGVDWGRLLTWSQFIAHQERKLLQDGTIEETIRHFDAILPKRPFLLESKNANQDRLGIFPRPRFPRWPWFHSSSQSPSHLV